MPSKKKVARPQLPKATIPRTRTEVTDDDVRQIRKTIRATDRVDESTNPQSDKPTSGRGVVQRAGRVRADGSRTGAGTAAKATYYIPVDVADEIAIIARRRRTTASAIAAEALAAFVEAAKADDAGVPRAG